ncbi:MAG: YhcH/YjgK/YiaL family protein [Synergistaceae bacterium]|jgi:YhcH/YjgK/YiaL family protein|nr:YhcH/YjgK/YiaL family protein [Synergistaceae bacterium]
MIMGTLQYLPRYNGLGVEVQKTLRFLVSQDLSTLSPGRYSIDGDGIQMDVVEAMSVLHDSKLFEAHEKFIDLHLTLSGEEWYGYAPINNLQITEKYDPEKDVALYGGEGVYFQIPKGQFVLFFPEDSHKAGVTFGTPGLIRKLVVKIRV